MNGTPNFSTNETLLAGDLLAVLANGATKAQTVKEQRRQQRALPEKRARDRVRLSQTMIATRLTVALYALEIRQNSTLYPRLAVVYFSQQRGVSSF